MRKNNMPLLSRRTLLSAAFVGLGATVLRPAAAHPGNDASLGPCTGANASTQNPLDPPVVVLAQLDFDSVELLNRAVLMAHAVAVETRKEDGCLHYAYGVDVSEPMRLQLSEWWRDESSLAAHLQTSHLRAFRLGLRKLGGSKAKVKRYAVSDVADLALPPLGA